MDINLNRNKYSYHAAPGHCARVLMNIEMSSKPYAKWIRIENEAAIVNTQISVAPKIESR